MFNKVLGKPPASAPAVIIDTPAEPAPDAKPKRVPWKVVAARPANAPRKNGGQAFLAARAARTNTSTYTSAGPKIVHREISNASLKDTALGGSVITLSNFPAPGNASSVPEVATLNEKFKGLQRKMSFTKPDDTKIDLSLTTAENEKNTGLGLQPSCSLTDTNGTTRPPSVLSMHSAKSLPRTTSGNSLGDGVGFTFKNTNNFVHPSIKQPRQFTPLSRSRRPSEADSAYENEEDDIAVERMNSVTSDGGWASGWSMNGSQNGSFSGPSGDPYARRASEAPSLARRPSVAPVAEDDDYEDDYDGRAHEVIHEDYHFGEFPGKEDELLEQSTADVSPEESAETSDVPQEEDWPLSATSSTFPADVHGSQADLSLGSHKSNDSSSLEPEHDTLSHEDTDKLSTSSSSPVRETVEKAKDFLSRPTEPEDAEQRAANIAAARKAFEDKEAAKDRKEEEKEAARQERRRRRSEATASVHSRVWRRTSVAFDSPVDDTFDEKLKAALPAALSRKASESKIGVFGSVDYDQSHPKTTRASVSRRESEHAPDSAQFPTYKESSAAPSRRTSRASHRGSVRPAIPEFESESELENEPSMLWPPPAGGQIYNIDGKFYDEFGMEVTGAGTPKEEKTPESDSPRSDSDTAKGKAKGKFIKFSAWSKTRMLRV